MLPFMSIECKLLAQNPMLSFSMEAVKVSMLLSSINPPLMLLLEPNHLSRGSPSSGTFIYLFIFAPPSFDLCFCFFLSFHLKNYFYSF